MIAELVAEHLCLAGGAPYQTHLPGVVAKDQVRAVLGRRGSWVLLWRYCAILKQEHLKYLGHSVFMLALCALFHHNMHIKNTLSGHKK